MTAADRLAQALELLPQGTVVSLPREALLEALQTPQRSDAGAEHTVADLAARFHRGASTIRGWLEAGRFPGAFKLRGRDWRIPPTAIRAFIQAQQENGAAAGARARSGRRLGDWRHVRPGAKVEASDTKGTA